MMSGAAKQMDKSAAKPKVGGDVANNMDIIMGNMVVIQPDLVTTVTHLARNTAALTAQLEDRYSESGKRHLTEKTDKDVITRTQQQLELEVEELDPLLATLAVQLTHLLQGRSPDVLLRAQQRQQHALTLKGKTQQERPVPATGTASTLSGAFEEIKATMSSPSYQLTKKKRFFLEKFYGLNLLQKMRICFSQVHARCGVD